MKCENCLIERSLIKTQKYQYDLSGLDNVFLDNIEVYSCSRCLVQVPIIPKILKLHNTIAFAVVCKNSPLTGAEIRFLRKNLRVKSQDWAKLLRSKKETVSRWENDSQAISPQSDLLIRYVYLRLLEERKELRLEKKIAEILSETTDEKTAIVIDVAQIDDYSYMSFTKAMSLAEVQNPQAMYFDFEIDESNWFLSEIERPMPFEKMKNDPPESLIARANCQAAANQELALAA
jgi:putative transcriptional regulator